MAKWYKEIIHQESFEDSIIYITKHTDGVVNGVLTWEVHSALMNHPDPIGTSYGFTVKECVEKAKKAHRSYWGYVRPEGREWNKDRWAKI